MEIKMTNNTHPLTFFRLMIVMACVAIVIAALMLFSSFISPVLLAIFLAILVAPIFHWLQKKGLPQGVALLAMIVGVIVIGLGLTIFLSLSFGQLANSLSVYQAEFEEWVLSVQAWLASQGINLTTIQPTEILESHNLVKAIADFLGRMGSLVFNAFFIILTTIFVLLETTHIRPKLQEGLGPNNILLVRGTQFGQGATRYFGLRSIVNLITGGAVAVMLLLLGVDFALLWGVLTFFLSFIPYLGIFVATIPSVLLAWAQYGLGMAVVVILGVSIINFVAENVIAPRIIGQGLSMSPVVVFLGFMFWSWVLGPLGMFLSMPLTIMVMLLLDSFDETRWAAKLMVARGQQVTAVSKAG
jgi:predicted PurR-regulated permease PerM